MSSILTRFSGALATLPKSEEPFRLMDVGCSGGIDSGFLRAFPNLLVDGFDPLVEEIERINALMMPGHSYHNYFVVGGTGVQPSQFAKSGTSFHLTSAFAAQKTLLSKGTSYTQQIFNSGDTPSFAQEEITLDAFLSKANKSGPNFLKIDTDGHDYFVLQGAKSTLADPELLGVQIECQFHGMPGGNQNTFSNIDEFMRSAGFTLFSLETHKYSRAELPQPFVWKFFGQTTSGQVQWGEALYLRDPSMHTMFKSLLAENENLLANYLRLLLHFDLPDVAAATLGEIARGSDSTVPWSKTFLDHLVPPNLLGASTYESYLEKFAKKPELFLPSSWGFPGSNLLLVLEGLTRKLRRGLLS